MITCVCANQTDFLCCLVSVFLFPSYRCVWCVCVSNSATMATERDSSELCGLYLVSLFVHIQNSQHGITFN